MMIDCSAKRLEVAACTSAVATLFDVGRAGLRIYPGQFFATPKVVEPLNSGLDLELIAGLADVGQINREDISTIDVLNVLAAPFGLILTSDVVR
ncbi:hypothetical protein UB31_35785 [Bradyrhizobium sp. LTSP849]|nr:hypothetical protein UB31_35785 [Bradyrhizobium sp. LTSP849]